MAVSDPKLRVHPYQEALAHYLSTEETEVWNWFSSAQAQADRAEALRLELLKTAYRLEAPSHPALYLALDEAKARLGLDLPVFLYQSQANRDLNAALLFIPGEAHIVFSGPVLDLLDPAELRGVLGHELAHYLLWTTQEGRYLVAERIANAMAVLPNAKPSQQQSARLFRLYTEIYADRGAWLVTDDPAPVISGLVKTQTGLSQVDPSSYIRQAEEIFSRSAAVTDELTHPEAFIRARAIDLWHNCALNVDAEVTWMIEGASELDQLDLLGQRRLTALTQRWLELYLSHPRLHTGAVGGHAKLFFPGFDFPSVPRSDAALVAELKLSPDSIRDYFCYLLLDFCAIDPDLELQPLIAAFSLANSIGWGDRLQALVIKDLKFKKREVEECRAEAKQSGTGHG